MILLEYQLKLLYHKRKIVSAKFKMQIKPFGSKNTIDFQFLTKIVNIIFHLIFISFLEIWQFSELKNSRLVLLQFFYNAIWIQNLCYLVSICCNILFKVVQLFLSQYLLSFWQQLSKFIQIKFEVHYQRNFYIFQ